MSYVFGKLEVILDDAAHALKLGAHVRADSLQRNSLAQLNLAFGVHATFPDETSTLARSLFL
jgi:hypothetical protein